MGMQKNRGNAFKRNSNVIYIIEFNATKNILNYEVQMSLEEGISKTIPYYENIWQKVQQI